MRCHGYELVPHACIGTVPPHMHDSATERHHPFFGRATPGIICGIKCNHDIRALLTFPPATPNSGDDVAATERLAARMAAQINNATHYVTDYAGKAQPHMNNLFRLLQIGQERLEEQLRQKPDGEKNCQRDRAWRTSVRMLMSCQKRVHKSMQEMVAYLLGIPENFCTHDFRLLYYATIVRAAEAALPHSDAVTGMNLAAQTEDATVYPPQACPTLPVDAAGDVTAERDKDFDSTDAADEAPTEARLFWASQYDDYRYRGGALADWPLYFYVAGVSRYAGKNCTSSAQSFPFDPPHPAAAKLVQKVRTKNAWCVPELVGPLCLASTRTPRGAQ